MGKMDRVANLLAAKAMLDELPDAALYPRLGDWANSALVDACRAGAKVEPLKERQSRHSVEHECGAVACFGGWVAQTPYFQKKGVKCDRYDGSPKMGGLGAMGVSLKLFGNYSMFSARQENERGTERQIIEKRIEKALRYELGESE